MPATHHFTSHADPQVDARIRSDLEAIRESLLAASPAILEIVLTGGFGRGEGTVTRDGSSIRPCNDYDLVVFVRAPAAVCARAIHQARHELAARLGMPHIDVELIDESQVDRPAPAMHRHDLQARSMLVHGDGSLLARLPPVAADHVGPQEALTLLVNRLTCPLESVRASFFIEPPTGHDRFRMAYLAHKVTLSVAAARLACARSYRASCRERALCFASVFPTRPELAARVERATRFKLAPPDVVDDPRPLWFEARDDLVEALVDVVSTCERRVLDGPLAIATHHRRRSMRERLRALKWYLLDRHRFADIAWWKRKRDIEAAELLLAAAPRPSGDCDRTLVDAARRALAAHVAAPLNDWEDCRREAVAADYRWVHPDGG